MSDEQVNGDKATGVVNIDLPEIPGFADLSVLGIGGMSTVYKATQVLMGRTVAIKVLHKRLVLDASQLQRFQQEAKLSTMLDHPNIARVYALGTMADTTPYLVMEYCPGRTLKDEIAQQGMLAWPRAVELFQQICNGVAHPHSKGIIHRDLKPSNVFIVDTDEGEVVKVLDFGIAKFLGTEAGGGSQKLTQTGVVLGSPHYMSPEQCMGGRVDERLDVYSLGCMLFESLTGKLPFEGETPLDTAARHLSQQASTLSDASSKRFSVEIEDIVATAMAKLPEQRFQSVTELADAIARAQGAGNSAGSEAPGKKAQYKKPPAKKIVKACSTTDGASSDKSRRATWKILLSLLIAAVPLCGFAVYRFVYLPSLNDPQFNSAEHALAQGDDKMARALLADLTGKQLPPWQIARAAKDFDELLFWDLWHRRQYTSETVPIALRFSADEKLRDLQANALYCAVTTNSPEIDRLRDRRQLAEMSEQATGASRDCLHGMELSGLAYDYLCHSDPDMVDQKYGEAEAFYSKAKRPELLIDCLTQHGWSLLALSEFPQYQR
jgi:serine/threonine protein kinase